MFGSDHFFFFSSRRRHTRLQGDWSSDVCSSDLRDVVGGDFYQFSQDGDGWFATVADCTGHGVPGAFMTLIATSSLSQAIKEHGPRDPAALLGHVNRSVKQMLGQLDGKDGTPGSDDGLDAACFWFEPAHRRLRFAGADRKGVG